jgi:hypothetical protein
MSSSLGNKCPYRYAMLDNNNEDVFLCSLHWFKECDNCILTKEQSFSIIEITTDKENEICLNKKANKIPALP